MALTFPSSPADGATYSDETDRTWVFKLGDVFDADYNQIGAWRKAVSDMSLVFRKTREITPTEGQEITLAAGRDNSLFLAVPVSLNRVDFLFPLSPTDGQMVLIHLANVLPTSMAVRLVWSDALNNFSVNTFHAGESYAFQYIAARNVWRTL